MSDESSGMRVTKQELLATESELTKHLDRLREIFKIYTQERGIRFDKKIENFSATDLLRFVRLIRRATD